MPAVDLIVPWQPGCPHRERALLWVLARYATYHPEWRITVAATEGVWCKADAVNPAVQRARDGIVVIADADVWTNSLELAVEAVDQGIAGWAVPHRRVLRLTEQATTDLIESGAIGELEQPPYEGVAGGGMIVAHRDALLDAPFDPRFTGWGQEDLSIAIALRCLHGEEWRGTGDLLHLWHPAQPRLNRKTGSLDGMRLHRRYRAARDNPAAMRALIKEGKHVASEPDQPALHDHAPV